MAPVCIQENNYNFVNLLLILGKRHRLRYPIKNQHLVSGQLEKTRDLDELLTEPAICSRNTGQRMPCFDRCHLTITGMSNFKGGRYKPRLHVSVSQPRSQDLFPSLGTGRLAPKLRKRSWERGCL